MDLFTKLLKNKVEGTKMVKVAIRNFSLYDYDNDKIPISKISLKF